MLRYQLNPHFLFNTLNSLYSLVEEHPTAGQMVLRLSEFCRSTLTRDANHPQTLDDELHMLAAYLDIEKVRWSESLRVELDIDDAARAVRIPPFLLLPLVENAIKHGSQTSREILRVRITARLTSDDTLKIEIANTGHWLALGTSEAPSTQIGLKNLRQRLARSYPNAHTLHHESADGWVVVKLNLDHARASFS
jgi:LytS/YehU family sensor histidine kinase